MSRRRTLVGLLIVSLAMVPLISRADTTDSTTYGSGDYGYCDYGSCSITLTSGGAVSLPVTPASGGRCTIQSDSISVETDNTLGYTVTVNNSLTSSNMVSGGNTIGPTTATDSSPSALSPNTWGYRVDGTSGFGSGPTTTQTNAAPGSVTFAGVPNSGQSPAPIITTSAPANPAAATTVWYGLCADPTQPSGSYSTQVIYTAVTN